MNKQLDLGKLFLLVDFLSTVYKVALKPKNFLIALSNLNASIFFASNPENKEAKRNLKVNHNSN